MLLVINAPSVQVSTTERSVTATSPSAVAQLTAAMRRGDEEAYRRFFEAYFHRLLAYLLVVTHGNEELARDLLQQTMIKVARHIKPFDDEDAFWRWLIVLARTAAFDHGRKLKRYLGFLQRFWADRALVHETPGVPEEECFHRAIDQQLPFLAPEDRDILEKKYIEELSVKEIATELNLTEKAVESRLSRTRAKLKELTLKQLRHE